MHLISRTLNIGTREWPRVLVAWGMTFIARIGFVVGWITLTAMFVARFGIAFLPTLFILNAIFMIGGSFLYAELIPRMKKDLLILITVLMASLVLFMATFFAQGNTYAYFFLLLVAESVFVSQLFILLSVFIEELFSPLESERAFPFIESAETLGAIVGGFLIAALLPKIAVSQFIFLWIVSLLLLIPVLLYYQYSVTKLRPLIVRKAISHEPVTQYRRWKDSAEAIRKIPFLKGLFLIMLTQWIFFNMLEFQYTKAVEQHVLQNKEETLVQSQGRIFHVSLLTDPHGAKAKEALFPGLKRETLTESEERNLTHTLGFLSMVFGGLALFTQLIFASRFIRWYGIIGSFLIHPILLFLSFLGVFFKFGFLSNVVMRSTFDIGYVIHRNAYHSSFYALKPDIREQAHEFLDGLVKPLGVIIGMTSLLLFHLLLSGKWLTFGINIIMATVLVVMVIETLELKKKYTELPRSILFSNEKEREKWNAVEILSQSGHRRAVDILLHALQTYRSAESLHIRILKALGKSGSVDALPGIISSFSDRRPNIRFAAVQALNLFEDFEKVFQKQIFSRYRLFEALRQLFKEEQSEEVRSAIMLVFSRWKNYDVVPFLLEVLESGEPAAKAQCLMVCSRFRDPGVIDYIIRYLEYPDVRVRANAAAALWNYPSHQEESWMRINSLLKTDNGEELLVVLSVLGNIATKASIKLLKNYLENEDLELRFRAGLSLMKLGSETNVHKLVDILLQTNGEKIRQFQEVFRQLNDDEQRRFAGIFAMYLAEKIHGQSSPAFLERLKDLYEVLGYEHYAYEIQQYLEGQGLRPSQEAFPLVQ